MRNSWRIFKNDWRSLGKNAISWVVVLGLIVIPSLYAWFCIYAFWDPYNHTENLKVAVACDDMGYKNTFVPVNINIGKEVVEELRENHQLNWVFVNRKEALEGVRSGAYYAALVIPVKFSQNLMSILSDEVQPAEILFYINEKENAIAAKVTNQGAGAIQKTIDETVAEKTSEITLRALETVSAALNDQDTDALAETLRGKLHGIFAGLSSAADTLDTLCVMNETLVDLLRTTDTLLRELGTELTVSLDRMPSKALADTRSQLDALGERMDAAFQKTEDAYSAIDRWAAQYLNDMDADAQALSNSLNTYANRLHTVTVRYQELRDGVEEISASLPAQLELSRQLLNDLSVSLDRSIRQQTQVYEALTDAASDLTAISSDAVQDRQEISALIADCSEGLRALRDEFQEKVQPQIGELADALALAEASARAVSGGLKNTASEMQAMADPVSEQIDQLDQTLTATRDLLRDAAGRMERILIRLNTEGETGAKAVLEQLMHQDAGRVSSYLSSVVKLDTHVIYPVNNFGAAMTPFYTCLAIWVGAIILAAMLKADVSAKTLAALTRPRNWQLYLGRFGIFLTLSLLQSLLIALGDLFFLGVVCAHPVRFVLTCLYIGLVFVTIVYTLTASFGNIGKALAVILLVFQVAGSGGTIPIEMTPPFFHRFYPLLPVTHSMAALRECVAGLYGSDYWIELGILAVYIGLSLLLGLVLRNPMINMNHRLEEKVEGTKVM